MSLTPRDHAAIRAELRNKMLVCHCAPLPCHGLVLAAIANSSSTHPWTGVALDAPLV